MTCRIMLAGDVMLGRGIDQILAAPSPPQLYEAYAKSALLYVSLAEKNAGPLPRRVDHSYVWGDALEAISARAPQLRIINLETAVTRAEAPAADKGIHYRMNPANVAVLTAASIDCCVLANNHSLDWGAEGLVETLDTLNAAGLATAGAGRNAAGAAAPAAFRLAGGRRVLVYGFACRSSGVPATWAAGAERPGLCLLDEDDPEALAGVAGRIRNDRRDGDIVIASIHWGPNWGYRIVPAHRDMAARLVDVARVDLVHGHSSHHPIGIALRHGHPVFYGCGDLLNDYEGIEGSAPARSDLALLYFVDVDAAGRCTAVEMVPFRIAGFRLHRASAEEARSLAAIMARECGGLGGDVTLRTDDRGAPVLILRPAGRGDEELAGSCEVPA